MNTEYQGKKITLFLVDGEPDGEKTIELDGWNGLAIAFPRNKLKEFSANKNAIKSGVYFLFGQESEDSLVSLAYIGHADNIIDRLNTHNHDESKEFWHQTVVFVGKDDSVTRAHAKYIESRCVQMAYEVKHFGYKLTNGNEPTLANLPQSDIPGMERFLENANLILATIGYPILQKVESKTHDDIRSPLFFYERNDGKIKATARMTNEGFLVYKGSTATTQYTKPVEERTERLATKLIVDGILRKNVDQYIFEHDYSFKSPSGAGVFLVGYPVNGWDLWRAKNGKTLGEVYKRGI